MTSQQLTVVSPNALSVYGPEQENLKALATSLKLKSEDQIISGPSLAEEMSLVKWQGGVKEAEIFSYKVMSGYKDKELLLKVILAAITWFIEGFKEGSRMRSSDIFKMGLYIFEYKAETLEDVILCFKMAEAGQLRDPGSGQPIKRYAKMDLEILKQYWHAYLDHKSALREARVRNEKNLLSGGDFRTEEDSKLIEIERKGEFLKDYRAATGQVQRWHNSDSLTPIQRVISEKYKTI